MNGDPADILDEAAATLDRLRDLKPPSEVPIHVPTAMERWKADAEASERAREQADREFEQRQAEAVDATELAAAEQEAESEAGWDEWLRGHLAVERQTILDIMAEVVGEAMGTLRKEFGTKVAELTRQAEAERDTRRRERDAARSRVKAMQATYAEKIATLQAQIDAQRRAFELLEIRQRESKADHARRVEREESAAVMMRALYEEFMLRR
jgi:hypothetical protein